MAEQYYSLENIRFLLDEVFDTPSLCERPYFSKHSGESLHMIVEAADALCRQHLRPILIEMDRNPPVLADGKIRVHPKMRELVKKFGEDGWISMSAPEEFGGQQVPFTLLQVAGFMFSAANYSTMAYPFLTNGAAHLIESFGSKELQQTYIPKMYSGEWQGTMALTEPEAGSSLSDIVTTAYRTQHGHYLIRGQKIFISCGDHDACDNIIHLMLARIEGAPAGTKGISLFVVPQKRLNSEGQLEHNDVNTAGVFHKMGYHGAPIAHLMMGEKNDCRAYLVGEEHKGLHYMFQMMNEARIGVGISAVGIASAAYYHSLEYARVRKQGRKISEKNPANPPIEIIHHADVKRLLLFQKAVVEGSLALELQATTYFDRWKTAQSDEEREKNFLLLELLTPIAKSYPAEMSILTTSAALQCFGGYGYTKDFLAELFYRETRIHTLHEGTTAIHGLDLLGRKVMLQNGKATMLLMQEIQTAIDQSAPYAFLAPYATILKEKINKLQQVTMHLLGIAQTKGADVFLSDATLYLELTGIIVVAWQWLKQGIEIEKLKASATKKYTSSFLASKQHALSYFFEYEIPKTEALFIRLQSNNHLTVTVSGEELV